MGLMKEFKEFAMKGNVVDLAVGVIIGAAFGGIVKSLTDDIIMPAVGKALGNMDFTNYYLPLSSSVPAGMALADAKKAGHAVLAYGNFLTIVLNFIILAFCIFMMVKAMNRLRKKEEAKPAPAAGPTPTEKLLGEIRDLLQQRR